MPERGFDRKISIDMKKIIVEKSQDSHFSIKQFPDHLSIKLHRKHVQYLRKQLFRFAFHCVCKYALFKSTFS